MELDMDTYHAELRRRLRKIDAEREERLQNGGWEGLPTVPQLMAGKTVFLTGGSGFLGAVLIEKLLRSCPDIGSIVLLLRSKKGVPALQRIPQILNIPLFDPLKRANPAVLSKVVAVEGDCSEEGLGLSPEDRAMLLERVNIVFHGAASVRFDDPLRKAVLLNTRGTREVVDLCTGMHRLEALVHISTAYTNMNQKPCEERLYPTDLDWRQVIKAASNEDTARALDLLGPKVLGFHPNSYTFTKSLAEQIMGCAAATLPVIIVRPSIVVGAVKEPLPGWLDSLNSPSSMWGAVCTGLCRSFKMFNCNTVQEFVPVDIVTKVTILAAWVAATKQRISDDDEVPVVNVAISDVHEITGKLALETLVAVRRQVPFPNAIRYPFMLDITNKYLASVFDFFYHILFGVTMDLLLRIGGQKPRLMKLYRKVANVTESVKPFTSVYRPFGTHKLWKIPSVMHPNDIKDFDLDLDSLDPRIDGRIQLWGLLKYALKEKDDPEKDLQHLDRLLWAEMAWYCFVIAIVIYFSRLTVFS